MRCLLRNQRPFKWAQYLGDSERTDGAGRYTGGHDTEYGEAQDAKGNISSATGYINMAMFGANIEYDKLIILENLPDGFDEHSVLWVDDLESENYDYIVNRIAKSINGVTIAITKVNVG